MFEFELEKGSKKFACPSCGAAQKFKRYISNRTGEHAPFEFGRCDRESSCGYHQKPKQFFADNPQHSKSKAFISSSQNKSILNRVLTDKNAAQAKRAAEKSPKTPDYIPFESFKPTLSHYEQNAFVQFLSNLFPDYGDEVQEVLKRYFVGTFDDYTCFPQIDRLNRICKAKLIRFNPATGKRLKGEYDTSSLPAKLKLKADFNYKQIFFGEHLLSRCPDKPAAVVEAEKTAVIASLYFPGFVWLATGSKQWLKTERLQRLGNRQIILYPDADGFNLWQGIAADARKQGLTVKVSSLIENHATAEQRESGYDLADYLINGQAEINQYNSFVEHCNAKIENILNDEDLMREFETIINERLAVAVIDNNLSEQAAFEIVTDANALRVLALSLAAN